MKSLNLVHISSLPPTRCGIAEYASALAEAIHVNAPGLLPTFVQLQNDAGMTIPKGHEYITVNPLDVNSLQMVAGTVNRLERPVVLLQHEFKLFGGPDGENVVRLLAMLNAPVVTTLHTVWPTFPTTRHRVFCEVLERSVALVVLSPKAARILRERYGVPSHKVKVIPHGVADAPFQTPEQVYWPGVSCSQRVKFITSGLLRPAKGIEQALAAFGSLRTLFPNFSYVICGVDHPKNLAAAEYRRRLEALVSSYDLQENVVFINRFLDRQELIQLTQACDVGVLPYVAPEQSSSGVLAFVLACGRPVVATNFQCATALLREGNGVVVPLGRVPALEEAIEAIAKDTERREHMMRICYESTRHWVWKKVAQQYVEIVEGASIHNPTASAGL